MKNYTPENITSLKENEVFVFGSNEAGIHGAGAALYAKNNFGAIQGNGFGLYGKSFAIPTKDFNIETLDLDKIENYIKKFVRFAKEHKELTFYVTKIGCGLANLQPEQFKNIFANIGITNNIILPIEFCVTTGYKAYGKGLICREKQYEVGEIYEEAVASICNTGFHFCEDPFSILDYYSLIDSDCNIVEITEVKALSTALSNDNNKFCTRKIQIGKKLNLFDFIDACIRYKPLTQQEEDSKNIYLQNAKFVRNNNSAYIIAVKDSSKVIVKGEDANITTLGGFSDVIVKGDSPKIISIGAFSKIITYSNMADIKITGHNSKIISFGERVIISNFGMDNQIVINGFESRVLATENNCKIISNNNSEIISNGSNSEIIINNDNSQITTTGKFTYVGVKGNDSKITINGTKSKCESIGKNNILTNIGNKGIVKGIIGNQITLAEYDENNNIIYVKSAIIDGKVIKENVWYQLIKENFNEITIY